MKKTKGELNLKEYLVISFAFGSLFKKSCNSNVDDHSTVSQFKTVEDCDKVFPPPTGFLVEK